MLLFTTAHTHTHLRLIVDADTRVIAISDDCVDDYREALLSLHVKGQKGSEMKQPMPAYFTDSAFLRASLHAAVQVPGMTVAAADQPPALRVGVSTSVYRAEVAAAGRWAGVTVMKSRGGAQRLVA